MAGGIRGAAEALEEGELPVRLYETMMDDCVMMDKVSVPDGIGGFVYDWQDGAPFRAAIVKDSTTEARIAEQQGIAEMFTVTFPKTLPIAYHDVFKRVKDGSIFRATSSVVDSQTPQAASFQFGQVSAERWKLA